MGAVYSAGHIHALIGDTAMVCPQCHTTPVSSFRDASPAEILADGYAAGEYH